MGTVKGRKEVEPPKVSRHPFVFRGNDTREKEKERQTERKKERKRESKKERNER
jgi:hypothetical protein